MKQLTGFPLTALFCWSTAALGAVACSGGDLQLGQDKAPSTLQDQEEAANAENGEGGASAGSDNEASGGHAVGGEAAGGAETAGGGHAVGGAAAGGEESAGGGHAVGGAAVGGGHAVGGAAAGGAEGVGGHAVGGVGNVSVDPVGAATADPADPYGSCEPVAEADFPSFPFGCSTPDTACTGWGSAFNSTYFVVCDHTCETSADCPTPSTGDAVPTCLDSVHACELPCDDETTCPNGYQCVSTEEWGLSSGGEPVPLPFICMQLYTVSYQ